MQLIRFDKSPKMFIRLKPIPLQLSSACMSCSGPLGFDVFPNGLVKKRCESCNRDENLRPSEFFSLRLPTQCPQCGTGVLSASDDLPTGLVKARNYGVACGNCDIAIELADIIRASMQQKSAGRRDRHS